MPLVAFGLPVSLAKSDNRLGQLHHQRPPCEVPVKLRCRTAKQCTFQLVDHFLHVIAQFLNLFLKLRRTSSFRTDLSLPKDASRKMPYNDSHGEISIASSRRRPGASRHPDCPHTAQDLPAHGDRPGLRSNPALHSRPTAHPPICFEPMAFAQEPPYLALEAGTVSLSQCAGQEWRGEIVETRTSLYSASSVRSPLNQSANLTKRLSESPSASPYLRTAPPANPAALNPPHVHSGCGIPIQGIN